MKKGIVIGAAVIATTTLGANAQFDQIGDPGGGNLAPDSTVASQIFEVAFSIYSAVAIDNFTISAGADTITGFSAMMSGFNSYGGTSGVTGYNIGIYSSPTAAGTSLTGDVANFFYGAPTTDTLVFDGDGVDTFDINLVTFDISTTLAPGEYWIGLSPENEFGVNGQTGIARSSIGDGLESYLANPGGGFGLPGGTFSPLSDIVAEPFNLAYSIDKVPAPGALAVLGLAGIVGTRRRRN